jgi:4-hydroxybenzoate polyprenyltransferase
VLTTFLISRRYDEYGLWLYAGTLVFLGLLWYQHRLVKPDDLSKVTLAFFTTNGIASLIFGAACLIDFYL